uniref:ATPase 8 n=1 Tax=Pocillopora verrucosa TaxID=203993 RepID=K7TL56_9CNID|nr:ATPase 8 [Pocillopora verrucosa]
MPQLEVGTYNIQYWWGFSVLFFLLIFLEVIIFPFVKRGWWIRQFLLGWTFFLGWKKNYGKRFPWKLSQNV